MESKIKEVIDELVELCERAHINHNINNLFHVLIAYLRTPKEKSEYDYTINAVIASIILNTLDEMKETEVTLDKSELAILCKSIMINIDEEPTEEIKEEIKEDINVVKDEAKEGV